MFCPSCGKQIPEDAQECPDCNKQETVDSKEDEKIVENIVSDQKITETIDFKDLLDKESVSEEKVQYEITQKAKSNIDTDVGGYLKGFFKDPFQAILNRTAPEYWLWGLIVLGAYVLLVFLGQLAALTGAGYAFASMFCLACGLASMIFGLFIFQGPFQLEKKSLNEIVAAVGLSMTPMFILFFAGSIFDAAAFSYLNNWQSVLNLRLFTPPFVSIGYIFSAIVLGRFYAGDDVAKMKRSFLLVLVAFATFFIIESLFMYVAIRVG